MNNNRDGPVKNFLCNFMVAEMTITFKTTFEEQRLSFTNYPGF